MSRFAHARRRSVLDLPAFFALACVLLASPAPASAEPVPTRLRLGAELGLGPVLGDSHGGALQLDGQLGLQANDLLAIYWQSSVFWEGWANGTVRLDTFAFWSNLGMIDLTFWRFLQLGFGAGADFGSFGTCSATACTQASRQTHLGTEARLAFVIPLPGARARWGIPLAAHFHSTWIGGSPIHALTVTVGVLRF